MNRWDEICNLPVLLVCKITTWDRVYRGWANHSWIVTIWQMIATSNRIVMADHLVVGLSAWIIQDGNYGDFTRGDRTAFALEFWAQPPLTRVEPRDEIIASMAHRGSAIYEVVARVVHVAEDWWAIDVGVLVYQYSRPPDSAQPGAWLRGNVFIGIDPFLYFEDCGRRPGAPALVYEWSIDKIEIETAPFVEVSPRRFERDASQLGWREVAATTAWEDDSGMGDYLLHCTLLAGPRLPRSKDLP
ncbi:hypothetical protein ACQR10_02030 [Bradyrhizobium sp. HKCCYLRH2060]|uniref:hypothetical protein n=1 Tax=Bradyrhizobium TaxID=374 RepID=UPI0029170C24|nr:hypothetical protein [Bradyrhizobium sp. SZCCHNR3003]